MDKRTLAVTIAALLLSAGATALAQDKSSGVRLTAAELQKLVDPSLFTSGRDLTFGAAFGIAFARGGTAYIAWANYSNGAGGQDRGKWRLNGDTLCETFPLRVYQNEEQCRYHYRLVDGSYESRDTATDKLMTTYQVIGKK